MTVLFDDLGLGDRLIDYNDAWDTQRAVHADVVAGSRPDTVLLLEHQAVYTAGKRTEPHERPTDGAPVVDVDRGGKITWHGPASWWPTRSSPSPTRSGWSTTSAGWRRR